MKKALFLFTTIISFLILSSCSKSINDDCASTDPKEPTIYIRILDSSGNSLIGENNLYKPSEITLTRGDQTVFLSFGEINDVTFIRFLYPDMVSEKDYQLKLNDQENDILKIKYKLKSGECFDYFFIEGFYVNDEEIAFDNDTYSFIIQK